MSYFTVHERGRSLRVFSALLGVVSAFLFSCGNLSAEEGKKSSALTVMLQRELAYLKAQKTLNTEIVSRYRRIRLELPERLTKAERDVFDQYQQEYMKLRRTYSLTETESKLVDFERISTERARLQAEKRKRQTRFLTGAPRLPGPVKKKIVPVTKRKKAAAPVSSGEHIKRVTAQMKREIAVLHTRAYALTSKRIIVKDAKDSSNYASEFAKAVKLFEDWKTKKSWTDMAKRHPYLAKTVAAQRRSVDQTLTLLKDCQAIHELAYKGGKKMKGVHLGRYRVVSTDWRGVNYSDGHFEQRFRAEKVNLGIRMRLANGSAARLGKHKLKLNDVPVLAYYHILAGDTEIAARGMNLTMQQKQVLSNYFKTWGLPEKENQILLMMPAPQKKEVPPQRKSSQPDKETFNGKEVKIIIPSRAE